MKNKNIILAILISAVLPFFTSCNKQDAYPSHLEGVWAYLDEGTGDSGLLVIKDNDGGQSAFFTLFSSDQKQTNDASGSFIYDSSTGKGYISTGLVGGSTSIVAYPSTDSKVDVVISRLVSSGTTISETYTFEKKAVIDCPTGKWAGTKDFDSIQFSIQMEITSIEPVSGSCGTLCITHPEEGSKTGTITEVTSFFKLFDDIALGAIFAQEDDSEAELPLAVVYNLDNKNMTITEFSSMVDIELELVDED